MSHLNGGMEFRALALDAHQSDAVSTLGQKIGRFQRDAFHAAPAVNAGKAQGNMQQGRHYKRAPSEEKGMAATDCGAGEGKE